MLDSISIYPIQTMRFTRYERHNPIDFNARRQAAFARKQARERERYPLFGEHVAAEQHTMDEEIARRTVRADSFEHRMRAVNARCWRDARKIYFAQAEARARRDPRQVGGSARPDHLDLLRVDG